MHTMQQIATLMRLTDQIREIFTNIPFVQAEDMVMTQHLLFKTNFTVYHDQDDFGCFYRKFSNKTSLTQFAKDIRVYQDDYNYNNLKDFEYEDPSIHYDITVYDDLSNFSNMTEYQSSFLGSLKRLSRSVFNWIYPYRDSEFQHIYSIFGHFNPEIGFEVDSRKIMYSFYKYIFSDIESLEKKSQLSCEFPNQ